MIEPRTRQSPHSKVADSLGREIMAGTYKPGDGLPAEEIACVRFEVSRTAYREAIRTLAAKGLVLSKTKIGTKIADRSRWRFLDPDVLRWAFEQEPEEDFVKALFELRRIIEPSAAQLAALRRSSDHLAVMRHALAVMAREPLVSGAGSQADVDFHSAILAASGNDFLISLSDGIGAAVRWTTIYKTRRAVIPTDTLPDHLAVFEAIANSDPQGSQQHMIHLMNKALQSTKKAMHRQRRSR